MSRTAAPVVTGVSPKDGPPGTRITIRGENLGFSAADLIGLTICDCDCTLSAEWKSPNKIIARSGPGKGLGDIIVTTRQGGQGTCTVKFRGYTETIGPTKESAVWVDTPATLSWARRSLSPQGYQQEDPLGLSVESTEKIIPEDDLHELFPGQCGDLGSEFFSAEWFLLENHHSTNFDDLKAGLYHMKRNIDNQKRGELSFLKANASSVLDQLDTLNKLKDKYENDAKSLPDFTSRVLRKIEDTKEEAYLLFEEVLSRRERADTTRNGLAVLQRFKFLFCLPSVIEQNVQKGEFDVIINDYARVRNLFGNTEVNLFKKVLGEIEVKIDGVRSKLLNKLENASSGVTLDDYVKIIRSLLYLEAKGDVAWLAIEFFSNHLEQEMHELKDKYIVLETSEAARRGKLLGNKAAAPEGRPQRVLFVEELVDLMELKFPDLWKLGQAYFRGDFNVHDPANPSKFKQLVLTSMSTLCNLVRAAILPHSLPRGQNRQTYGTWPNAGFDAVLVWLPHCLRYARACHSCFTRIDLPSDALNLFSKLIYDLRLYIVTSLFRTASEEITHLPSEEDWVLEENEKYGGITSLPRRWDAIVRRVVRTANETALAGDPREPPLLDQPAAQKEAINALHGLFTSFASAIEVLALVTEKEISGRGAVVSQLVGTAELPRTRESSVNWQTRLLTMHCNAEYATNALLPSLFTFIKECGLPCNSQVQTTAADTLGQVSSKLLDQHNEYKCDPLVGTIEPSMYMAMFEWDTSIAPTDVRPYAKEIIINIIGVRSELHRVPLPTVKKIMIRIVETVAEELARLMTCVQRFSVPGAVQARADMIAVRDATLAYKSAKSARFFVDALAAIPSIPKQQESILTSVLSNFRARMALQLLCLNESL